MYNEKILPSPPPCPTLFSVSCPHFFLTFFSYSSHAVLLLLLPCSPHSTSPILSSSYFSHTLFLLLLLYSLPPASPILSSSCPDYFPLPLEQNFLPFLPLGREEEIEALRREGQLFEPESHFSLLILVHTVRDDQGLNDEPEK